MKCSLNFWRFANEQYTSELELQKYLINIFFYIRMLDHRRG